MRKLHMIAVLFAILCFTATAGAQQAAIKEECVIKMS